MNEQEYRAMARTLAVDLRESTGDEWSMQTPEGWPGACVVRSRDGLRVQLREGWNQRGRLSVSVVIPPDHAGRTQGLRDLFGYDQDEHPKREGTTTGDAGRKACATRLRRVLALLPGFEEIHAKACERRNREERADEEAAACAARIARKLGGVVRGPCGSEVRPGATRVVHVPGLLESIAVEPYGAVQVGRGLYVDEEAALEIAASLARYRAREDSRQAAKAGA